MACAALRKSSNEKADPGMWDRYEDTALCGWVDKMPFCWQTFFFNSFWVKATFKSNLGVFSRLERHFSLFPLFHSVEQCNQGCDYRLLLDLWVILYRVCKPGGCFVSAKPRRWVPQFSCVKKYFPLLALKLPPFNFFECPLAAVLRTLELLS